MNNLMKCHLIILLLGISGILTSVQAQPYFSANIGMGMLQTADGEDEEEPGETFQIGFDNNLILSGAVGYNFESFRGELEIAYQKNNLNSLGFDGVTVETDAISGLDGSLSSLSGLINGYFDFDTGTSFRPYLTAGLGLSKVKFKLSANNDEIFEEPISESDSDSTIAYHLGAGLGYAISENVILDLRYRYFMTSKPKYDTATLEYKSHNITGGVRVNF